MVFPRTKTLAVAAGAFMALVASVLVGPSLSNAALISNLDENKAIAISQAAIGRVVGDYVFRDTQGRQVRLADFQGKPLIISMIYSSCVDVCPTITNTLENIDAVARDALGDDAYNIVTIGFDVAVDNPVQMESFARENDVPINQHWRFLSGDIMAVAGLSQDIGFLYEASIKGVNHLTQTTVLDGEGRVYVQIYGDTFPTPALVDPLKNLVFGTETPFASWGDLVNKVRLFCTLYDPASDQYRFEYTMFFRMFVGAVIILSMIVFIGRWLWQDRRRRLTVDHERKTRA